MRCDYANAGQSILAPYADKENAAEVCRMTKRAAAFYGMDTETVDYYCQSARRVVGYTPDGAPMVHYSKSARCPLLGAVIQLAGSKPRPREVSPLGVYPVGVVARFLDMSPRAVRMLIKRRAMLGTLDKGGFLVLGEEVQRFIDHGHCVLASGRRGVLRRRDGGKNGT